MVLMISPKSNISQPTPGHFNRLKFCGTNWYILYRMILCHKLYKRDSESERISEQDKEG